MSSQDGAVWATFSLSILGISARFSDFLSLVFRCLPSSFNEENCFLILCAVRHLEASVECERWGINASNNNTSSQCLVLHSTHFPKASLPFLVGSNLHLHFIVHDLLSSKHTDIYI